MSQAKPNRLRRYRVGLLALAAGLMLNPVVLTTPIYAQSAEIAGTSGSPDADLREFISRWNPQAKLSENNLVTLPDGTQYVVVFPAQFTPTDALALKGKIPSGDGLADVIELNDGRYLLRIVTLPNGRKTFPLLAEVPEHLKSGLLPQNFLFTDGFLLPTMWKSLTGNLLVEADPLEPQAKVNYPLAVLTDAGRSMALWDAAKARTTQKVELPCKATQVITTSKADAIFALCASEKSLLKIDPTNGKVSSIALEAPANQMAVDNVNNRLYITYPTAAVLSVFEIGTGKFSENTVSLPQPGGAVAVSPFRKEIYVIGADTPSIKQYDIEQAALKEKQARKKHFWEEGFVIGSRKKQKPPEETVTYLTLIDLNSLALKKKIRTLPDVTTIYLQDEKLLWMASASEKTLRSFDLRWHEFSPPLALSEAPVAMGSHRQKLYLLMPQSNTLERLNLMTSKWDDPIPLQPATVPGDLIIDPLEHQAFVVTTDKPGLQIVNLNRAQWVGTEQMPVQPSGETAWLVPESAIPSQRVRIKFQDARLLLQNGLGSQWAGSLSAPHGQQKSQDPPVPPSPQENR